jgi:hypothetical protein
MRITNTARNRFHFLARRSIGRDGMRLRARMHLIVALPYLVFTCMVLAACAGSLGSAAPPETIAPAEPDANPLGDDPDVIPFDRSTAYDHGFARGPVLRRPIAGIFATLRAA